MNLDNDLLTRSLMNDRVRDVERHRLISVAGSASVAGRQRQRFAFSLRQRLAFSLRRKGWRPAEADVS